MFTICIFYSVLSLRKDRVCEGASKLPRPQKFYRAVTAPPDFEISGSAPALNYTLVYEMHEQNVMIT